MPRRRAPGWHKARRERRRERALIGEYTALLDRLTTGLTRDNVEDRAGIAARVMEIRGFGPVKDAAVDQVRGDIAQALEERGL